MRKFLIAAVLLVLAVGSFGQEGTVTFYVNDEARRDVVTFTSKAPLETIVGRTGEIKGFVTVNPANITATSSARFEVDLASLKTGIGLRDRHMRENHLHTDKYPKAIFELTAVTSASQNFLDDGKPVELVVEGDFSLHGVTRPVAMTLTATYIKESEATKSKLPGDLLHIQGTFDVLLSDYNIPRPQFIVLKLDDKQKVEIDVFGSTKLPAVMFSEH